MKKDDSKLTEKEKEEMAKERFSGVGRIELPEEKKKKMQEILERMRIRNGWPENWQENEEYWVRKAVEKEAREKGDQK